MSPRVRVTFEPAALSVEVESGTTLLEAATGAGLVIPAPCGGRGACGRCAVTVGPGQPAPPDERELRALRRARTDPGQIRLACMAKVGESPVTVRARSLGRGTHEPLRHHAVNRTVVGAVDLGTTTVSAAIIDPRTREHLGSATVGNRQTVFGADILSRISAALEGRGAEVRGAAEASVIEAVEVACEDAGVETAGLRRIAIAANTAMLSLLAGVDVTGLAVHPFGHALSDPVVIHGRALMEAYPGVDMLALPPVAGFVGGDLTAGLLGEGLAEGADGVAFLDIGTNAEIAVLSGGSAFIASAPAGPAFEGWGIACGGRAGPGGIVAMESSGPEGWMPVTGGVPATHLTGSGLLSAVARLRELGHLGPDGRMSPSGPLAHRFFLLPDGVDAVGLSNGSGGRDLYLSQLDIRAFQYAKAAVCVALRSSLARAGGSVPAEYVIAGTFGGALAPEDLISCGVLPLDARGKVRHAGNAALAGAAAVALEPDLIDVARRFVSRSVHVDLAADGSFTERFIAEMGIEPYTL